MMIQTAEGSLEIAEFLSGRLSGKAPYLKEETMMSNGTVCQSCGMPLANPGDFGKEADGSPNGDYCRHCYPNGAFNSPNETMEQMIESCIPFCRDRYESDAAARADMREHFPLLKRWARTT
ncbi:MAG: zinc ribbon domain-containing protein [Treponema sp.]|nr:zinc ribbon domain-containing protein [Treponema sp.]